MELGAISVPFREEDGSLPECAGKGPGSLEAWVSLVALRRRLEIELAKEENHDHPLAKQDIPIKEKAFQLRDFCEKEDPLARHIFKQQAHILGWAMGDQASELDPGLIVIGGGLLRQALETGTLIMYALDSKKGHLHFTLIHQYLHTG